MEDESDLHLRSEEVVSLTNIILAGAGLTTKIQTLYEVQAVCSSTSLSVAALETLLRNQIPDIIRRPVTADDRAFNIDLVVARLSILLGMRLSHISGLRIVKENSLPDCIDLVEILATLMRASYGPETFPTSGSAQPAALHAPSSLQGPDVLHEAWPQRQPSSTMPQHPSASSSRAPQPLPHQQGPATTRIQAAQNPPGGKPYTAFLDELTVSNPDAHVPDPLWQRSSLRPWAETEVVPARHQTSVPVVKQSSLPAGAGVGATEWPDHRSNLAPGNQGAAPLSVSDRNLGAHGGRAAEPRRSHGDRFAHSAGAGDGKGGPDVAAPGKSLFSEDIVPVRPAASGEDGPVGGGRRPTSGSTGQQREHTEEHRGSMQQQNQQQQQHTEERQGGQQQNTEERRGSKQQQYQDQQQHTEESRGTQEQQHQQQQQHTEEERRGSKQQHTEVRRGSKQHSAIPAGGLADMQDAAWDQLHEEDECRWHGAGSGAGAGQPSGNSRQTLLQKVADETPEDRLMRQLQSRDAVHVERGMSRPAVLSAHDGRDGNQARHQSGCADKGFWQEHPAGVGQRRVPSGPPEDKFPLADDGDDTDYSDDYNYVAGVSGLGDDDRPINHSGRQQQEQYRQGFIPASGSRRGKPRQGTAASAQHRRRYSTALFSPDYPLPRHSRPTATAPWLMWAASQAVAKYSEQTFQGRRVRRATGARQRSSKAGKGQHHLLTSRQQRSASAARLFDVERLCLNPTLAAKLQHIYNLTSEDSRAVHAQERRQVVEASQRHAGDLSRFQQLTRHQTAAMRRDEALLHTLKAVGERNEAHRQRVHEQRLVSAMMQHADADRSRRMRQDLQEELMLKEAFERACQSERDWLLATKQQEARVTTDWRGQWTSDLGAARSGRRQNRPQRVAAAAASAARGAVLESRQTSRHVQDQHLLEMLARLTVSKEAAFEQSVNPCAEAWQLRGQLERMLK